MDNRTWMKMSVTQKLSYLNAEILKAWEQWQNIYENGCNDPFWPDGTNLNLVRNHIIYYLNQINDLTKEPMQMSLFGETDDLGPIDPENDPRVPVKVDEHYMARERRCFYFE